LIETDVRVLAATNVGCTGSDEDREFREDLYYRLNVLSILVPPLGRELAEIPLLFRISMENTAKIRQAFAGAVEAPAGCSGQLPLARKLARAGEFR